MSGTHAFERIKNFRDFGGYHADARRIKTGLLYRSGDHAQASDADLAALAALNIKTIVDLRHSGERGQKASRRWAGFDAALIENDHHGPTPEEEAFDAALSAYLNGPNITADGLARWQLEAYETVAFAPRHVDLFTRYFQALAKANGPILIHCSRGKDRTGLLAALTHTLLGVSRDDIFKDYLLANGVLVADVMRDRGMSGDVASALVDLRADYLIRAFDAMTTRYGSVDRYLSQALGVDAHARAAIEERILE